MKKFKDLDCWGLAKKVLFSITLKGLAMNAKHCCLAPRGMPTALNSHSSAYKALSQINLLGAFWGMAFIALMTLTSAQAQTQASIYPNKPLKIIVPYSPGGFADSGARAISEALGTRLGQSIVIDNRPGASGVIGTMAVSSAAPDGYTLLLGFDGTLITYPMMVS